MSTLPLPSADVPALASADPLPQRLAWWQRARFAAGNRGFYVLADQVVYSFGNMAVAALLSRRCPLVAFGIYILTQRTMDVLIQLSNVLLWGPLTFRLPGLEAKEQRPYLGSIVVLQTLFCCGFTLLLFAVCKAFQQVLHFETAAALAALVPTAASLLFREFNRRLFFATMRLKQAFWTELATVVLQVGGVGALVFAGRLTVASTLLVLAAGALCVAAWWIVYDWKTWTVHPRRLATDLRHDFRLGRWLLGSNLSFLVSAQCNPWLLNAALGGAAVGSYAIGESLVNIPRVALTSLQNIMGPAVARAEANGGRPAVKRLVKRLDLTLLGASTIAALGICFAGPQLAHLIYGRSPVGTRLLCLLLSINLVVYACSLAQSYGLTALGRADTTFYANGLGLLVQAMLALPLIRSWGIAGAALALLVGNVIVLIARGIHWRRVLAV